MLLLFLGVEHEAGGTRNSGIRCSLKPGLSTLSWVDTWEIRTDVCMNYRVKLGSGSAVKLDELSSIPRTNM